MQPDDDICYCYHISMRKLVNFARRVRPVQASRMTECLGAGTGCGWCIPFLTKIAQDPDCFTIDELTSDQYAESRKNYIKTQPRNSFEETPKSGNAETPKEMPDSPVRDTPDPR